MEKFKLTKKYVVECEWVDKRDGFKHSGTLYREGKRLITAEVHYINRTWESFEFKSVLLEIVDKYFKDKKEHEYFRNIVIHIK